jgi:hypothetical protein
MTGYAKQSRAKEESLDRFVATLLAMTRWVLSYGHHAFVAHEANW